MNDQEIWNLRNEEIKKMALENAKKIKFLIQEQEFLQDDLYMTIRKNDNDGFPYRINDNIVDNNNRIANLNDRITTLEDENITLAKKVQELKQQEFQHRIDVKELQEQHGLSTKVKE